VVNKQILLMAYLPHFIPITVQFKHSGVQGDRHVRANIKYMFKDIYSGGVTATPPDFCKGGLQCILKPYSSRLMQAFIAQNRAAGRLGA
jgi:hypothetical protein